MSTLRVSVRLRLALVFTLAELLVLVAFSSGVVFFLRFSAIRQADQAIHQQHAAVAGVARKAPSELHELEDRQVVRYFLVREAGRVVFRSARWERAGLPTDAGTRRGMFRHPAAPDFFLKVERVKDPGGRELFVAVAVTAAYVDQVVWRLALILALCIPGAGLLSAAFGYWLAGQALGPVRQMAATAREIGADRLDARLPVANPDDEFGQLATVFNETLARLEAAFDAMRRFSSDASHELRTPLAALRAVGEVGLREGRSADELREAIGSMLEEAGRLGALADNLLALSRADAGTFRPALAAVDVTELGRQVVDLLRVLAEEKDQQLVASGPDALLARADPALLRQALVNLVDNAVKFTPARGRIEVATGERGGEIHVSVQDNGPGIPAEVQARVFERFYQVDPSRSSARRGAGLGLAIARTMTELQGGRIEVSSALGSGTRFTLVLPAAAPGGVGAVTPARPTRPGPPRTARP